jgi:hypothetical protein
MECEESACVWGGLSELELAGLAALIILQAVGDVFDCIGRDGEIRDRGRLDELTEFFHGGWCDELLDSVRTFRLFRRGRLAWLVGQTNGEQLFHRLRYDAKFGKIVRQALKGWENS